MSKISFLLLLASGAACLGGCAGAAPAHDVYAAGDERPTDIYRAWPLYQQLAENNTVAGELRLADLERWKVGEYRSAYYWYERAALDGSGIAAANLWYMYANGHAGPGESPEAVSFFHLAAQTDEGRQQLYALEMKAAIDSQRRYPSAAGQTRGTAIVEFQRGDDGKATEVRLYRSSGNADIDSAAIQAVEDASLPDAPPAGQHHFVISVEIGPQV